MKPIESFHVAFLICKKEIQQLIETKKHQQFISRNQIRINHIRLRKLNALKRGLIIRIETHPDYTEFRSKNEFWKRR